MKAIHLSDTLNSSRGLLAQGNGVRVMRDT